MFQKTLLYVPIAVLISTLACTGTKTTSELIDSCPYSPSFSSSDNNPNPLLIYMKNNLSKDTYLQKNSIQERMAMISETMDNYILAQGNTLSDWQCGDDQSLSISCGDKVTCLETLTYTCSNSSGTETTSLSCKLFQGLGSQYNECGSPGINCNIITSQDM